jgi:predicted metal-dependent HD superfamily phosphohydrolase
LLNIDYCTISSNEIQKSKTPTTIQVTEKNILTIVEEYITQFFKEKVPKKYVYHDLTHTQDVVRSCRQIGLAYGLPMDDLENLLIAAWFHDSGYDLGPENHEERSAENAAQFLETLNYPPSVIETIKDCIKATKLPQRPTGLLQQIICDADLGHLGEKSYWMRTARVRQELVVTQNRMMTEEEWLEFELTFMLGQQYHTDVAIEMYQKRKMKHILQLRKQQTRLNPEMINEVDDIFLFEKREQQKEKRNLAKQNSQETKPGSIGRGVETMYRTTYNTHNNLSALADHKANLMLSINTIMISIVFSMLVPQLNGAPQLILPTVVLLTVCMTSIIFATLSTRPKVTTGEVTLDDIRNKRSNLLFFGNFYNMKLEDFQWGMMEMIKDTNFQYSSMTRDLYYLGKVLAQKYRYLTFCYNIFMFGMILSVLLFAWAFVTGGGMNNMRVK